MRDFEIILIIRKLMCSLGYHGYHPSAVETKYIRNAGKYWVYKIKTQCMYCQKPYTAIISIAKPVKEDRDA